MRTIRLFLLLLLTSTLLLVATACVVVNPPTDATIAGATGTVETGTVETTEEERAEPSAPAGAPQPESSVASKVGDLGGTTWTLFAHGSPASLQAMAADTQITAEFSSDGRLSGSAGCNRYMTSFGVDGDQVTVGPVGLTRVMCVDEAVRLQEEQFVAALEEMAEKRSFRLIADQLEIELGDGNVLIFHAQGIEK